MEREVLVSIDLGGRPARVGRLVPSAFALDPELPLTAGQFHTQRPLFNAFTDPSPGRWGQTLLRRRAGLKPKELERMESAFEHDDLTAALR